MKYLLLVSFLFLYSCISLSRITKPELMYDKREGREPELNAESVVETGGVLYTEFSYRVNPAVKLKDDLTTEFANIPSSIRLSKMLKDKKEVYGTISVSDKSITYLYDEDNDGNFDQIMVQARKNATNWRPLKTDAGYEKAMGIKSESDGFELELIYEGRNGNKIEIFYGEYREDLTRASFTDAIEFEFSDNDDNILSYNGIRIEIIEATQNQLRYKILSGSVENPEM